MALDSNLYIHDADKAALAALKAIPGFAQVTKAFMKIWDEKRYRIINMAKNLRLGSRQMSKYYDMLPPICEKLGIEVPELYVTLDVTANAGTYGDTKPFICVNSGLFETVPEELIPTVLAHECGHIACHHALYTTMGVFLLSNASVLVSGLGNIALYPIQLAFMHWMRCSEYSADRAAIICDGSADKTVELMMHFAGGDKDIMEQADVDAFVEQAAEYREMVADSKWNKALEFLLLKDSSHPLTAVRAYEGREWAKSERCQNIFEYLSAPPSEAESKLPVQVKLGKMTGKELADVESELLKLGFADVTAVRVTEGGKTKPGCVSAVTIGGSSEDGWYQRGDKVTVEYFEPKTLEELALEHPGEIRIGQNHRYFLGKDYMEVKAELESLGFGRFTIKELAMSKLGWGEKENCVAKIIIGDRAQFDKDDWFPEEAEVTLYYFVRI